LYEAGDPVAPIAHHSGDSYQNAYSTARISFYGITGFPTVKFDGVLSAVGASGNMYPGYLAKVNQRMAIMSDFTIGLNGFSDGNDFTVIASVENVNPYTGSDVYLHFAFVESHIPENWGGLSEVNFVNRLMLPDQNGTLLDFSDKESETVLYEFTIQSSWITDKSHLIAFIQDMTSKEILQGFIVGIPDLMPMYYDNAGCLAVNMVPLANCTGEVEPVVTISNDGATNLSSVDINYKVNDETLNTYSWSGDLAYGETEMVTLPSVAFDIQDENDLLIYTTNPNGNSDEDPINDTTATSFVSAVDVVPDINLYLKLDDNPGESTWELKNSAGEVLYSGGPYTDPQAFIQETMEIDEDDCYTFAIYDAGGDGLAAPSFYKLMQGNFDIIHENDAFDGMEEMVQFSVDMVSVPELEATAEFNVFPNPFEDITNISFTLVDESPVKIEVYNILGEVVSGFESKVYSAGNHIERFNASDMNPGIYFINVTISDQTMTKKVSLR